MVERSSSVRIIASLLVILALGCARSRGGDWLSDGGDPQGTNWQRYGKSLTVDNVKNLKLLWKRQLGDQPGQLSSPVIIGPTITHRGVRELVFIADTHDNLYAVDADLGTLFWKRHFEVKATSTCASGIASTPVIEPDPDEDFSDPVGDEEEDDEAAPMRPLYAIASDGRLHTIRVSDGTDIDSPKDFLPPNASYSNLNFWSGTVYAGAWGCKGTPAALWSIDVKKPAGPVSSSVRDVRRVVIGPSGALRSNVAGSFVSTEFSHKGRELLVAEAPDGRLLLLDAGKLTTVAELPNPNTRYNGTATWQDPDGMRWIYAATEQNLQAYRLTGATHEPRLEHSWTYDSMQRSGPPAITNGVLFLFTGLGTAGPGYTTLIALNAANGRELFNSASPFTYNPNLAVANGHICFGDTNNTLSCFGIPMER
jgi:outer membrane protein assembly factor BamB